MVRAAWERQRGCLRARTSTGAGARREESSPGRSAQEAGGALSGSALSPRREGEWRLLRLRRICDIQTQARLLRLLLFQEGSRSAELGCGWGGKQKEKRGGGSGQDPLGSLPCIPLSLSVPRATCTGRYPGFHTRRDLEELGSGCPGAL